MKPLVIYDPSPYANDYLSKKYFFSIASYLKQAGGSISFISDLDSIQNHSVLVCSDYLVPGRISKLKNNGNAIFSFDINDSSQLGIYRSNPEILDIDLIFKFSGIQNTKYSIGIRITDEMKFDKMYLPFPYSEEDWILYEQMRGKIRSLPYVPWDFFNPATFPMEERYQSTLVRGGNHFYRYILYLNLLRKGLVGTDCSFLSADYFFPEMRKDLRYCPKCIEAKKRDGKITYDYFKEHKEEYLKECTSSVIWKKNDILDHFLNEDFGLWNNRCPPSFYFLADLFTEYHGSVDMNQVEKALNGRVLSIIQFYTILSTYLFYADYKWIFSVYAPPRFWEAAQAKVINVVPRRTNDQSYFPEMKEGDHYITFDEDFSDLDNLKDIKKEKFEHITNETKALYDKWIHGTQYGISENLIKYILEEIEKTG